MRFLAALLVTVLVVAGSARAQTPDFLKSSPGELTSSHASIDNEGGCNSCHNGDKSVAPAKCLGCHEHDNMKQRIDSGRGFHNSVKVKGRACELCHKEHRGRKFDPMGWETIGGPQKFDHGLTGFALQGKHENLTCQKCHTTSNKQGLRTYLGTERTCGGCHAKQSPHGQMRQIHMQCDRCHSQSVWQPPKQTLDFDHNDKAQAAMKLEGQHADVVCAKCHTKALFKLPSFDNGECSQCHKSPHDGQLFSTKKCQLCHSAALKSLKEIRFDHKKQTGYPLIGKHAAIDCYGCHTQALGKKKPDDGCEQCHAKDNKHGNRFSQFGAPPVCATCHTQRAWKTEFQFNHLKATGWELTAKHSKATCRACHRGKSPAEFEKFDINNGCMSCHRHKTAHGGKFQNNQCLTCHTEGGSKKLRSDSLEVYHGEKSKFPLRNGHAGVKCEMCHVNDVYENTPSECGVSCHEDSLHRGTLGKQCSQCHEPGLWTAPRFDHTQDTKWPLKGKHPQVKCEQCHPSRQYANTATSCGAAGCHKSDDIHQGQLGSACEKCHHEDGANTFLHNRDSKFKIDGGHTPLLCANCHKTVTFKPVPSNCFGCHPEPAVHKGRFGTDCARCHSTTTFADMRALHDVGDFSLSGAHDQLDCSRCHPNGEKRRGSGNLCITCHRKDDIHKNSLSPQCGTCHTQRSFAPARFDHLSVGCGLTGLHSTLPCADCHKNGNYAAVSPTCVSCHRNDALKVRAPDHRTLIECGRCHNPSAWVPATQNGAQTICR